MMLAEKFQKLKPYRLAGLLLLCLALGGTSQDVFLPKSILQFICTGFVIWSLYHTSVQELFDASPCLSSIFAFCVGYCIITIIPLPPLLWTALPGREIIADGFALIDAPLPWMTVSMTSDQTLFSLFMLLPPVAIYLVGVFHANEREIKLAIWALLFFTAGSVLLGLAQMISTAPELYLYTVTNAGKPVAFFSNINHQATLLLMSLPIALTLMAASDLSRSVVPLLLAALIILGIVISGSAAGILLFIPAVILSLCAGSGFSKNGWCRAPLLLMPGVVPLCFFILSDDIISHFQESGETSRAIVWSRSVAALKDYFPFGTGLGSFSQVYPLYEPLEHITNIYPPHAHNDYLELVLELGLGGVIVIIGFSWWLTTKSFNLILTPYQKSSIAHYAIISAFLCLAHSSVDYPMRTIAISAVFAFCICLVVCKNKINI
jgi:O-antigen ligase